MAVNSQSFQGRPRCNSCGFCSGYGCPILARGSAAVSFLHPALLAGARLRTRCMVHRVDLAPGGRRAVGVSFRDEAGVEQHERADVVIMAASAMETPRLALLSANADHPNGLGNRSGQLGRNIMFHLFSLGIGIFADDLHAWRGPSSVLTIDDFVGPDTSAAAKATGMPFLKGGICETGGGSLLLSEAGFYTAQPNMWGQGLKELMRTSPLRVHLAGISMVGEDLPQEANRVDLDPKVRDVYGLAVPRITHSAHPFELAAAQYFGPRLGAICRAAPGVLASGWLPIGNLAESSGGFSSPYAGPASTAHIMGTARMGDDPTKSVVDPWGRMHDLDNVYVADGSAFTSSGGFNPTLTIMALALRMARRLGGPPLQGGDNDAVEIGAVAAGAAVLTAGVVAGGLRVRRRAAEQRVTQQD